MSRSIGAAIGDPSFTAKLGRDGGIGQGGAKLLVVTDVNNPKRQFFCKQGRNDEVRWPVRFLVSFVLAFAT